MGEGSIKDFFKAGDSTTPSTPSTNPAELTIEVRRGKKAIAVLFVNGEIIDDLIRSFGEMISNSD